MCLGVPQAAAEALLPIDEGPEYDYLQAPGQLSDADDEEPWIPDPHKPKAARTLNFDLVASTDVCAAHAQPPAGSCSIPATEQEGPNNNAATGAVQTGQGKPSDDHRLHDKQAVPDVEKAAPDRHCQPQREPHNVRTRETAGISKTPASAQRRKKQARQQRLEPELGKEAGGAAKSFHEEAAPVGHGGKAARVGHAGSGKTQQTTASMHRTTANPRAQMAGQVKTKIVCCTLTHADSLTSVVQSLFASDMELSLLVWYTSASLVIPSHEEISHECTVQIQSPRSARKPARTQPETGKALERSKTPGQPTTYARTTLSPKNVMEHVPT